MQEPVRCVHRFDKSYTMEYHDGTPVPKKAPEDNLVPQDNWPYLLGTIGQPIYWKHEGNTPDIEGEYIERRIYNNAIMAAEWRANINIKEALHGETPLIRNRWSDNEHDDLFGSQHGILYYACMPQPNSKWNGVMVGNDSYHWGGQPGLNKLPTGGSEKIYDLQHTQTHELFHLLGLTHDTNYTDHIMWAFYNGQRLPQKNDIFRLQRYGIRKRDPLTDFIIQTRLKRGIK